MGLKEDTLYLVFNDGYSFHRDKFNNPENKIVVEDILERVFGKRLIISNLLEKEYAGLYQGNQNNSEEKVKKN
jgi:DNA polymerase-3 subunit gamma/tau